MNTLLALLSFSFFTLLIIGLVSPKLSLFWSKGERTRRKSLLINGLGFVLSFVTFGAAVSPADLQNSKMYNEEKKMSSSNVESAALREGVQLKLEEPKYKKIGEQIEIGNFSYIVNSVNFEKSVGNEFAKRRADGIFLIVSVTFRNNDNEEHTLDNSFFKLTDVDQTEFSSSTEGVSALEMSGQETLFLKQCNPKISKSGFLIFEVPEKDVYDLHLSGGFWNGKTALVKLTTQ